MSITFFAIFGIIIFSIMKRKTHEWAENGANPIVEAPLYCSKISLSETRRGWKFWLTPLLREASVKIFSLDESPWDFTKVNFMGRDLYNIQQRLISVHGLYMYWNLSNSNWYIICIAYLCKTHLFKYCFFKDWG